MKKILLSILLFLGIFLWTASSSALSIGVKPKNIDIQAGIGRIQKTEILVTNIGEEPAFYNIYPDNFTKNISISPSDFLLAPQSGKIVEIKTRFWLPWEKQTNLSIVARSNDVKNLSAIPGIKLPIAIKPSLVSLIITGAIVVVIFCIFMLFMVKLLKRNKY